jgi:RHS repeat-associated protein
MEQSTGFRPLCWQYHWNGDNPLTRLITPEGKQWFYQYDPLGRRVMKWHSSHQQQKTHYLWFGDQLVGIRDECNEEHTHTRYWHYDGWNLLAQQFIESDDHTLEKVRTDWAISDPTALPLRFYNQTGQLTWQSPKRTLWGKAYQAHDELGLNELRFAGQQYDAESGLCYNRFRYYHPDSGCYLSPDPLGLQGGLNTHAYVPNPTGWVDPLGLAGCGIRYGELDHLGRPTGVTARLDSSFINTGTHANPSIQPPGFITGAGSNRARGHLLGRQLGGSGDDVRNLVTLQHRPVNTPDMSSVEARIRKALEGGEVVDLSITPLYKGSSRIPAGITINAQGNKGFSEFITLINPPGM